MSLIESYSARVAAGEVARDEAQVMVAGRLEALAGALAAWSPAKSTWFGGLLGTKRPPPKGLYIHGKVGRGKTMLMDLFYERVTVTPKRRVHFHEFMAETHERINAARKTVPGDPIPVVAAGIAERSRLLCFDELHVTDIADAMILGRLFKGLFDRNVVMVATSNAMPRELYRNGLNHQLFVPTIELIEQHMDVLELGSAKDYRLDKLAGQPLYHTPLNAETRRALRAAFARLTGVMHGIPVELDVNGRKVEIKEAANGVAYVTFEQLCAVPLAANDYLHLARAFHTVVMEGIPRLPPARRNEARRFINLIDTLYDGRIGFIASAEAEPHELYPEGDGAVLFERTVSRLIEMRSQTYLESRAERHSAGGVPASATG